MPGFGRLPNRYGTITKLSGKRRKPYCARKYVGEVWDDEKRQYAYRYVSVGTFATRGEALAALSKANNDANFAIENISFGNVADRWLAEKKPDISVGLYNNYKNAISKFTAIRNRKIKELKTDDLERIVNSDDIPRTTKQKCKIALNGIYDYALRHEYVQKDYSSLVKVHTDLTAQIDRKVFTPEEVKALSERDRITDEDVVFVMLYTGLRVAECLAITRANVDLENHLLIGVGMKTDAGKNRTVPIHDAIYPTIEKHALLCGKNGSFNLFTHTATAIPVSSYHPRFRRLFSGHTTHDCRHSFATYAYKCRLDATMVKIIMGHAVGDITKGRYTHITADDLKAEMKKYKIE